MRVLIQNVTNDQLNAAINDFANSPFPMDIYGEIALAAMYGERDRRRHNAPEFLVKVVDPCADDLAIYSKAELDEIARATVIADRMARALIDLRRANAVKGDAEKAAKEAGYAAASANENWRVLCDDLKHDFMPA